MELWRLALFLIIGLVLGTTGSTVNREIGVIESNTQSWVSLGCYLDNVSGRALPHGEPVPGGTDAMTNELCVATCSANGFTIAGTEYAGECWCGNAIVNGGGPAPDGNKGCNMKCKGNSAETCRGPNCLDVWQLLTGPTPSTLSPSTTTSSVTATSIKSLPTSTGTGSGKRGLAYSSGNPAGNAEFANLFKGYSKITWAFDWETQPLNLDPSFEFVPMLWGLPTGADPTWSAAVQAPGTKNILGFNEPDLTYTGSSNIFPAKAAAGYETYMEPFSANVKIGMPNVLWNNVGSSSGGSYDTAVWTSYFLGNCTNCHFDFAAIHYYQDCVPTDGQSGAAWFQGNITNAFETLHLPVWVTEFQCYGTDAQQVAFLQEVLPWMDRQEFVERYAYFGAFPGHLVNEAGTGLSDIGVAYATT